MKEIGGYLELDQNYQDVYHKHAVALNCGRAALEYLIRAKNIQKLYIPYFCCDVIVKTCNRCGIRYEYYHINEGFRPLFDKVLKEDEWLYLVNYYGQLSNRDIDAYKQKYDRVIADNAQSFFQMPNPGTDTLYTCRKFFGVPDGGYLYTDRQLSGLEKDESYERIHFVLGRYERTGSEFYREAADNNDVFSVEPMKLMSRLTDNLLRGLDYDRIRRQRNSNYAALAEELGEKNRLSLVSPDGAFMYPFYCENGGTARKKLQSRKIYIPILWPDVLEVCDESDLEYDLAQNILPLPVDQRYDRQDMFMVANLILDMKKN